jgi:MtaA/CmuA family methyltransferase
MNSKQRCLAVIQGHAVDRTPVFPLLMFFAQKRLGATYRDFATHGHVMAEAQLQIRETFHVDAITACTDAFRVAADLGADMVYPDDKPPFAATPLVRNEADLKRLIRPDPADSRTRMADRAAGVRDMCRAAGEDCLVLGWVDMPFAEACSLCGVTEFMLMMYDNPRLAHDVLDFLTGIVLDFCVAQQEAGAPMIGAGDAAASLISPELYREFALPYEQRICSAVHAAGGLVKLHICGNTSNLLADMTQSGADLFNVDHLVDFAAARDVYSRASVCFKGNMDPVTDLLQATPERCEQRALSCLRLAEGCRFMLSAGCEVPADTRDEVFRVFCESPKKYKNLHS